MMIKILISSFVLFVAASGINAQKIDSINFHLYTDSLKKGQHNYINVDGKLSNGNWLPLTDKEIRFSCSSAKFEGNELIIPENFTEEKVVVTATLKSKPAISIQKIIWIKQKPDPELPKKEEIIHKGKRKNRSS